MNTAKNLEDAALIVKQAFRRNRLEAGHSMEISPGRGYNVIWFSVTPGRQHMHQRHRVSRNPLIGTGPRRVGNDLQDTLSAASDRTDLERLFDRKVSLSQILKLTGRGITPERIAALLRSPDPAGDLKKLLDS